MPDPTDLKNTNVAIPIPLWWNRNDRHKHFGDGLSSFSPGGGEPTKDFPYISVNYNIPPMFSFFKKNNAPAAAVPEWCSFFTQKEYSVFMDEVRQYFSDQGLNYTVGDGEIELAENDLGFGRMGLVNLAQSCKDQPPGHFRQIVSGHFNSMKEANAFDLSFRKKVHDFEVVKSYIGVRLYHREYALSIGPDSTLSRPVGGEVEAVLVFDLPHSVVNIKPDDAAAWNKTEDELFTLGIENIRRNYPQQVSRQNSGGFSIWFAANNHFFTANIIFDFTLRPELLGSKGALVCLPNRHAAMIYPINDSGVIQAVNGLIPAVYGMFQQGPGSLSPELFLYRDGVFTVLPYRIEGDRLQFIPPPAFVQLLEELV